MKKVIVGFICCLSASAFATSLKEDAGINLKYEDAYIAWSAERIREGCLLEEGPFSTKNLEIFEVSSKKGSITFLASQHAVCGQTVKSFSGFVNFRLKNSRYDISVTPLQNLAP
jgi:hypothetical protein